jgi:hypothetical protein
MRGGFVGDLAGADWCVRLSGAIEQLDLEETTQTNEGTAVSNPNRPRSAPIISTLLATPVHEHSQGKRGYQEKGWRSIWSMWERIYEACLAVQLYFA